MFHLSRKCHFSKNDTRAKSSDYYRGKRLLLFFMVAYTFKVSSRHGKVLAKSIFHDLHYCGSHHNCYLTAFSGTPLSTFLLTPKLSSHIEASVGEAQTETLQCKFEDELKEVKIFEDFSLWLHYKIM